MNNENEQNEQSYSQFKQSNKSWSQKSQKQEDTRKFFWAKPMIEGTPPCARGGHSATLVGANIIFFGVSNAPVSTVSNFFLAGPLLFRKGSGFYFFE